MNYSCSRSHEWLKFKNHIVPNQTKHNLKGLGWTLVINVMWFSYFLYSYTFTNVISKTYEVVGSIYLTIQMEDETQAIGHATCSLLEWCWSNNMAFEFKYRVFPVNDELIFSPTLDLSKGDTLKVQYSKANIFFS